MLHQPSPTHHFREVNKEVTNTARKGRLCLMSPLHVPGVTRSHIRSHMVSRMLLVFRSVIWTLLLEKMTISCES